MIACVSIGTATVPLDTAVNVAFPYITGAFGVPVDWIQWVIVSYVLTYAGLLLGTGRIADVLGYKRIFIVGLALNVAAQLACALAPSFEMLIAARVVQGISAALILSAGPALFTLAWPESDRVRMLGTYTIAFGLAGAAGPLLGGLVVEAIGWSGVFWFRAPIALCGLVLTLWLAEEPRVRNETAAQLDLWAITALVIGMVCGLLALGQGPRLGEHLWVLLALVLISATALTGFAKRQLRNPSSALFDLHLMRDRVFLGVIATHVLVALAEFSVLLLVPYLLGAVEGLSPAMAGLILGGAPLGVMAASYFVKYSLGDGVPDSIAAGSVALVALALTGVSFWPQSPAWPLMFINLFAVGFGYGVYHVTGMDRVMGTLPTHQRAVAGSISMMVRTAGVVAAASLLSFWFARRGGNDPGHLHTAAADTFLWAIAAATLGLFIFMLTQRHPARDPNA